MQMSNQMPACIRQNIEMLVTHPFSQNLRYQLLHKHDQECHGEEQSKTFFLIFLTFVMFHYLYLIIDFADLEEPFYMMGVTVLGHLVYSIYDDEQNRHGHSQLFTYQNMQLENISQYRHLDVFPSASVLFCSLVTLAAHTQFLFYSCILCTMYMTCLLQPPNLKQKFFVLLLFLFFIETLNKYR